MIVGRIAGPFGVRGEIKVDLLTDFPERFRHLQQVYLGKDHDPYQVVRSRRHGDRILLTLEGISDPEAVVGIRGQEVSVPRAEAIPLPEGHYYLDDLVGFAVVTVEGTSLGSVAEVIRTGSNDVLVVGTRPREILIPVIRDAVAELDLDARRAVVQSWVLQSDE
jgi:16S rRNA processing protein RimM